MNAKEKPVVELDPAELEAKLDEIEQVMGEQAARPFRLLLGWHLSLLRLLEQKKTSIARLRRLLFGPRTERTSRVVQRADSRGDTDTASVKESPDDLAHGQSEDAAGPADAG